MTGKTDIVSVSNLPSHLSQPSRRVKTPNKISVEFVPILAKGQRQIFTVKSYSFEAKPAVRKWNFQPHCTSHPLPAVLPPVGRFVASQGGGGVRIPPSPFGSVCESFSARRKYSRRKGWGRARPTPVTSAHSAGSFTGSTTGVVRWLFRRAVGSETEKVPQLRKKLRGHNKNLRRRT